MKTALPHAYGIRALRLRLLLRRRELVREVHSHVDAARTAGGFEGRADPGGEDHAQTQQAELDLAEAARDSAELAAIDTALARMALGEYGLCALCGQPVPQARLEANPHALHCIACATAAEQVPG